jgi:predicted DNA-binding transcriptional regulator AlpA
MRTPETRRQGDKICATGESQHPNDDALLLPPETGHRLRISVSTLAKWRVYGSGPRFIRLSGNRIAYRESDLAAWIAGRAVASTAERSTYATPPPRHTSRVARA